MGGWTGSVHLWGQHWLRDLGLRSAVGHQADPGIRQLRRSKLGNHHPMDWSIQPALRSHLLFLVLFSEGVFGDRSLPFASITTRFTVSAFPLANKGQGTAQQVLPSVAPCSEAALYNMGPCKEWSVTSATSTILSYLFRCVVWGISSLLQVWRTQPNSLGFGGWFCFFFFLKTLTN